MKVLILLAVSFLPVLHGQRVAVLYPEYFSCAGLQDGSYPHPEDCTRFILCGNGKARDDPCLWCDRAAFPDQCQGSPFLYFDPQLKECRFPFQVPSCPNSGGGGGQMGPPGMGGGPMYDPGMGPPPGGFSGQGRGFGKPPPLPKMPQPPKGFPPLPSPPLTGFLPFPGTKPAAPSASPDAEPEPQFYFPIF